MSDLFVSLQKAVTYVCYGLVIVLAIVSVVVISNTIKITVFNRRKEIGIMKLGYATNGFIRFPFFVEGVTSGLISALIASAIVCGGYYAVYEWYGKNPTNLTAMFGGTLLPLQDLWYYVVLGLCCLALCCAALALQPASANICRSEHPALALSFLNRQNPFYPHYQRGTLKMSIAIRRAALVGCADGCRGCRGAVPECRYKAAHADDKQKELENKRTSCSRNWTRSASS